MSRAFFTKCDQVALPTRICIFHPAINSMITNNFFVSSTPMIFTVLFLFLSDKLFLCCDVLPIDVSSFVNSIDGVIQPHANLRLKTILLLQISLRKEWVFLGNTTLMLSSRSKQGVGLGFLLRCRRRHRPRLGHQYHCVVCSAHNRKRYNQMAETYVVGKRNLLDNLELGKSSRERSRSTSSTSLSVACNLWLVANYSLICRDLFFFCTLFFCMRARINHTMKLFSGGSV